MKTMICIVLFLFLSIGFVYSFECIDNDEDGYSSNGVRCYIGGSTKVDCNDDDPLIWPQNQAEVGPTCKDGIDNDCDGKTDCNDEWCYSPPGQSSYAVKFFYDFDGFKCTCDFDGGGGRKPCCQLSKPGSWSRTTCNSCSIEGVYWTTNEGQEVDRVEENKEVKLVAKMVNQEECVGDKVNFNLKIYEDSSLNVMTSTRPINEGTSEAYWHATIHKPDLEDPEKSVNHYTFEAYLESNPRDIKTSRELTVGVSCFTSDKENNCLKCQKVWTPNINPRSKDFGKIMGGGSFSYVLVPDKEDHADCYKCGWCSTTRFGGHIAGNSKIYVPLLINNLGCTKSNGEYGVCTQGKCEDAPTCDEENPCKNICESLDKLRIYRCENGKCVAKGYGKKPWFRIKSAKCTQGKWQFWRRITEPKTIAWGMRIGYTLDSIFDKMVIDFVRAPGYSGIKLRRLVDSKGKKRLQLEGELPLGLAGFRIGLWTTNDDKCKENLVP